MGGLGWDCASLKGGEGTDVGMFRRWYQDERLHKWEGGGQELRVAPGVWLQLLGQRTPRSGTSGEARSKPGGSIWDGPGLTGCEASRGRNGVEQHDQDARLAGEGARVGTRRGVGGAGSHRPGGNRGQGR